MWVISQPAKGLVKTKWRNVFVFRYCIGKHVWQIGCARTRLMLLFLAVRFIILYGRWWSLQCAWRGCLYMFTMLSLSIHDGEKYEDHHENVTYLAVQYFMVDDYLYNALGGMCISVYHAKSRKVFQIMRIRVCVKMVNNMRIVIIMKMSRILQKAGKFCIALSTYPPSKHFFSLSNCCHNP